MIEATRLTDLQDWVHTTRENMIADIGTRRGAKIEQISPESKWVRGLPWMCGNPSNFPFSSVESSNIEWDYVLFHMLFLVF